MAVHPIEERYGTAEMGGVLLKGRATGLPGAWRNFPRET
jgi:hypothetical protein